MRPAPHQAPPQRPRRWRLAIALLAILLAHSAAAAASLTGQGAVGDGHSDDTAAVQRAITQAAPGSVLDGENKVYSVRGSIRIDRDLTLRNASFVQDSGPDGVEGRHDTRTLFVRGPGQTPLRVRLHDIKVNRGANRHQGSPSDAAGIWIDGAVDSELVNVEITGHGRGSGLLMADVRNVVVRKLWVHDMTWAPCRQQSEGLPYDAVRKAWNAYMVVPMRNCAKAGAQRERIQEPLAGVVIVRSQKVQLIAPVIERLYAAFADGRELAWQTDGITIGADGSGPDGQPQRSDILVQSARIAHVWEGIDMTGQPLTGVQVLDARISDIHAIGVKAANGASEISVRNTQVSNSGLAGFAVGGKNNANRPAPATHAVHIVDSVARNTGANGFWQGQALVAGFRVMNSTVQDAYDVLIENSSAENDAGSAGMRFGFHAECRSAMVTRNVKSAGPGQAVVLVEPAACR